LIDTASVQQRRGGLPDSLNSAKTGGPGKLDVRVVTVEGSTGGIVALPASLGGVAAHRHPDVGRASQKCHDRLPWVGFVKSSLKSCIMRNKP
jgi:hypothetical protein